LEILKIIIKILFYVIDYFIVFYGLYFLLTGLFAFKKSNKIKRYKAKYKIAVLIAARNEEKVIGHLVKSLTNQKYPKELFDIFVIPNNCTDNTEEVAINAGAKIIECSDNVKSKGEVLKYSFKYMQEFFPDYEAYCVFDADNIVHYNFLQRMNDALSSGYEVAQGNRDTKNPTDSWISSSYFLFYLTQNFFFNRARTNIGLSSSINGTGFLVSKAILEKHGFETCTLTEDIEFAGLCAQNDVKIAFVEDAITYDEQPTGFVQSWKQRTRWTMGAMQCMYKYSKDLFITGVKNRRLECIDMSLFYLAPVVQIFTCLVIGLYLLIGLFNIPVSDIAKFMLSTRGYTLVFAYMFCVLISVIVLAMQKKSIVKSLKGILMLFVFMISWIPINLMCLYKKEHTWEQIEHNKQVDIESLLDLE
jgi:cellulose synthase/poly-beta-1,6-N-acetylglucosamine synthase-like glycosyltransferase